MKNISETNLVAPDNGLGTESVTGIIVNTHCIVCGKGFEQARKGKLYCSTRCKQFGYNHKTQIRQLLKDQERAITPKILAFFIDDYIQFNKKQKMLRRYQELEKKRLQWDSIEQEVYDRNRMSIPVSDYLLSNLASKKLTQGEEDELYEYGTDLDDHILELNARELSLEQWSFIKSLHLSLDEQSFFEVVSSLSKEFITQLRLTDFSEEDSSEYLVIKNKFINHCNLIATGVIKFEKKEKCEVQRD